MIDYKAVTKQTYNEIAQNVGATYDDYFTTCVKPEADYFLSKLPKSGKILDIGCGVGTHSKYFTQAGFNVESIDISEKMVEICKENGVNARVEDIETAELKVAQFDGVWAHTSLIHLQKEKLAGILNKIAEAIKPGGQLFIAVREGSTEGFEKYKDNGNLQRWFSNFDIGEIENYLPKNLTVFRQNKIVFRERAFLNFHIAKQ